MRLSGFLNPGQVKQIHHGALRVLEEVGVQVDHPELRDRLSAVGGLVETASDRVRFPARLVESLIEGAPKDPWRGESVGVILGCSVYQCLYADPATDELAPFDEDRLARYFALAESLPGIDSTSMLGLPFIPDDIPARRLPLAERLYAWKYGASPCGSVQLTDLCEPILDMLEIHASFAGKTVEETFNAGGFMVSPLRLAMPECEQIAFFARRGLRMWVGHLLSQGGTAPVTLAGTLVLALAEQLFMFILNQALWGDASLGLGGMASTIDMRTGVSCYGRPERQRVNLAFADIAAFYGCSCRGHTGTTDAHTPSYEAGAQKAMGTLATALATGHAFVEAGLLGIDEICSPVQLALDHDLGMCLRALLAEPCADAEECAFDEIAAVGASGNHLGTDFTVERFRTALFDPATWSNQLTGAWRAAGRRGDLDKARDIVSDIARGFVPHSHISEEEERALRAVIRDAASR
jgi:trimethylamine---corrinoid protein Co-methyltransferase